MAIKRPKKRSKKYLSEDMWEVVFYRVAVKSLGVCRCVCKTWHRIITSPYFVKTHLMITLQNKCILYRHNETSCTILTGGSKSIRDATLKHSKFYNICSILHGYNGTQYTWGPRFHGICNGLVCVSAFHDYSIAETIYLWNPTCRRIKKLPQLDNSIKDEIGFTNWKACVSFGYYDDDCKVFVIAPVAEEAYIVSVYSLSTNTWNYIRTNNWTTIHAQVDYEIYVHAKAGSYRVKETKFVDGTVYVIEVDLVKCFDLSTETIRVISFPIEFSYYIHRFHTATTDYDGAKEKIRRLAGEFDDDDDVDVFTSEAYGDTIAIFGSGRESPSLTMWILRDKSLFTPLCVVNKQHGQNYHLVGFLNDGKFLIKRSRKLGQTKEENRELYSCKLDNPKLRRVRGCSNIDGRIHSDYVETLLLLDEDNLDPIDLYSIDQLENLSFRRFKLSGIA